MKTPNFDGIARPYRWLEYLALGPLLQRTRTYFLARLGGCGRALILGDGDGRFTSALLAVNPGLEVHAVDLSGAMLALLKGRCPAAHTYRLDARTALPEGPFDLAVTHFFLDCLTERELEGLIARVAPRLGARALWLVSDFRIPTGAFQLPARVYLRMLYFAFRILTGLRTTHLPEHVAALSSAGFRRVELHHKLAGMLTTELWQAP